jgi:Right handed beta helix region
MRRFLSVIALVVSIVPAAFATNPRSAVSVNGSDANPCTVASPCRSFGAAILVTSTDGEVVALDTAGYGPFTATFPITISSAPGAHAAITATSTNGITVNAGSNDRVTLRNLVLIGSPTGIAGIQQVQAHDLRIINCTIRGFTTGIETNSGHLSVDHSTILDSGGYGIFLNSNGTIAVSGNIADSWVEGSGTTGLSISQLATVMVTGTTITRTGGEGVFAQANIGTGAIEASVTLEGCTISYALDGVAADAGGGNNTAKVYLTQNDISYNAFDVVATGAGQFFTFGNNRFVENGAGNATLTSIAFK